APHGVRPRDFPDNATGRGIEGDEEAVDIMILIKDDLAIQQNRRAARAVFVAEWSEWTFPKLLSVQIVAEDADAAKKDEEMLAVAGSCGGGGAADRMGLFDTGRS